MSLLLLSQLEELGARFSHEVARLVSENEVLKLKADYVGKKGALSLILGSMKDLPNEQKPLIGGKANELKNRIEAECEKLLGRLKEAKIKKEQAQASEDVTLPGRGIPIGHWHPIRQVSEEIEAIFEKMGFQVHEGPDIETDYYNFEALNFLEGHPARDMQDTFYISDGTGPVSGVPPAVPPSTLQVGVTPGGRPHSPPVPYLLRTHTSPVQIHVMQNRKPPIQMIAPGTVYRRDTLDLSHSPVFHQIEGLLVDEGVRFSDLKGVLENFVRSFFGPKVPVRFRPSFFPFTEPSAEVDIGCLFCLPRRVKAGHGKGCRVCKQGGFLEVLGCGMVSPHVLRNVGYNPEELSGFAFGMGIERLAMLKLGINDIRLFFESDLRFLEQF